MADTKSVTYNQTNEGEGVAVDARQDGNVFTPQTRPDRQNAGPNTPVTVRSAVDQGPIKTDATNWQVFDEQGRDMGGARSSETTDIIGSGYTEFPGAHNEQYKAPESLI